MKPHSPSLVAGSTIYAQRVARANGGIQVCTQNSGGETGRNVIRHRYCKISGNPSILNRSRSVLIVPIIRIQADDIYPFLGLIHKVPQRRPRINHPLILHTLYILITISHVPKVP